jgi:hypothetical protein
MAMYRLFPDTHPRIEALQIELLRNAPAWRKLEMVGQMNATVRLLAISGLRSRYPNDSQAKLRRRLADLLLGQEIAEKVYGSLEEDVT